MFYKNVREWSLDSVLNPALRAIVKYRSVFKFLIGHRKIISGHMDRKLIKVPVCEGSRYTRYLELQTIFDFSVFVSKY